MGPGPARGVFSVEVFLRDPILARIYASFGEIHGKLRTAVSLQARPGVESGTSRLPIQKVDLWPPVAKGFKPLVGLLPIVRMLIKVLICSKKVCIYYRELEQKKNIRILLENNVLKS